MQNRISQRADIGAANAWIYPILLLELKAFLSREGEQIDDLQVVEHHRDQPGQCSVRVRLFGRRDYLKIVTRTSRHEKAWTDLHRVHSFIRREFPIVTRFNRIMAKS